MNYQQEILRMFFQMEEKWRKMHTFFIYHLLISNPENMIKETKYGFVTFYEF